MWMLRRGSATTTNAALADLSKDFEGLNSAFGRPSIAPEKLLGAFYGGHRVARRADRVPARPNPREVSRARHQCRPGAYPRLRSSANALVIRCRQVQ